MVQFYTPVKKRASVVQTAEVEILSLDYQGQGVARWQGKTLFVTGALPGEKVLVRVYEDKRQYAKASTQKVLHASEARVKPVCPHYALCGGCQMQHIEYALQTESKQNAFLRLMTRDIATPATVSAPLCGDAYGYRRRARLSLLADKKTRELTLGFRRANAKTLVDIQQCPVLQPQLSALIPPLKQCLQALKGVISLGHIELVGADNGNALVVRHVKPLSESDQAILIEFAKAHQLSLFSAPDSEQVICLAGQWPTYQVKGLTLQFSPRDFIQVNADVNQKMITQALTWLALSADDRVLDLFCGMGNFTLPIAQRAGYVVGVEGVAAMVEQAKTNAHENQISNAEFFCCDLDAPLTAQPWSTEGFNKVLLDPARAGALAVMEHIVNLRPSHVVYVSCNPATLARDSQILVNAGYQLAELGALDMFPQTAHVESMALFIRRKK
ncbi:23S rRNA (uracil(1939)-C(5))-methyltransferase RlmD [Plesiomonas sp.]|uniref:23S rRNA (uracil(1939)-C(5))-methyltransferase RlmD n=1 Tax=Plesiomonas sp. TaxID=2486279 RepID=UPI003F3BA86C